MPSHPVGSAAVPGPTLLCGHSIFVDLLQSHATRHRDVLTHLTRSSDEDTGVELIKRACIGDWDWAVLSLCTDGESPRSHLNPDADFLAALRGRSGFPLWLSEDHWHSGPEGLGNTWEWLSERDPHPILLVFVNLNYVAKALGGAAAVKLLSRYLTRECKVPTEAPRAKDDRIRVALTRGAAELVLLVDAQDLEWALEFCEGVQEVSIGDVAATLWDLTPSCSAQLPAADVGDTKADTACPFTLEEVILRTHLQHGAQDVARGQLDTLIREVATQAAGEATALETRRARRLCDVLCQLSGEGHPSSEEIRERLTNGLAVLNTQPAVLSLQVAPTFPLDVLNTGSAGSAGSGGPEEDNTDIDSTAPRTCENGTTASAGAATPTGNELDVHVQVAVDGPIEGSVFSSLMARLPLGNPHYGRILHGNYDGLLHGSLPLDAAHLMEFVKSIMLPFEVGVSSAQTASETPIARGLDPSYSTTTRLATKGDAADLADVPHSIYFEFAEIHFLLAQCRDRIRKPRVPINAGLQQEHIAERREALRSIAVRLEGLVEEKPWARPWRVSGSMTPELMALWKAVEKAEEAEWGAQAHASVIAHLDAVCQLVSRTQSREIAATVTSQLQFIEARIRIPRRIVGGPDHDGDAPPHETDAMVLRHTERLVQPISDLIVAANAVLGTFEGLDEGADLLVSLGAVLWHVQLAESHCWTHKDMLALRQSIAATTQAIAERTQRLWASTELSSGATFLSNACGLQSLTKALGWVVEQAVEAVAEEERRSLQKVGNGEPVDYRLARPYWSGAIVLGDAPGIGIEPGQFVSLPLSYADRTLEATIRLLHEAGHILFDHFGMYDRLNPGGHLELAPDDPLASLRSAIGQVHGDTWLSVPYIMEHHVEEYYASLAEYVLLGRNAELAARAAWKNWLEGSRPYESPENCVCRTAFFFMAAEGDRKREELAAANNGVDQWDGWTTTQRDEVAKAALEAATAWFESETDLAPFVRELLAELKHERQQESVLWNRCVEDLRDIATHCFTCFSDELPFVAWALATDLFADSFCGTALCQAPEGAMADTLRAGLYEQHERDWGRIRESIRNLAEQGGCVVPDAVVRRQELLDEWENNLRAYLSDNAGIAELLDAHDINTTEIRDPLRGEAHIQDTIAVARSVAQLATGQVVTAAITKPLRVIVELFRTVTNDAREAPSSDHVANIALALTLCHAWEVTSDYVRRARVSPPGRRLLAPSPEH